jgi:hypothetical protein
MQNMEQNNWGTGELTDADLDAINGGNCIGDFFRTIGGAIEHAAEFIGGLIWQGIHQPGTGRGPFGNPPPGPGQTPF